MRLRAPNAREKAMLDSRSKICAAIQILPTRYTCSDMCDLHVAHHAHQAFTASMRIEQLEDIKDQILERHGEGLTLTQDSHDSSAIVTLKYDPDYFSHERPLHDFVIWVESLWNRARAHHRRATIKARSETRC
jgi:hypothetical protein